MLAPEPHPIPGRDGLDELNGDMPASGESGSKR